jgi:hypothetical protein
MGAQELFSAEIDLFYPSYALVKERNCKVHGADRVRTDDIQLAKLALSQLSYSPEKSSRRMIRGKAPRSKEWA